MRARDIKPGFYKSEQLAECSMAARLLFPGLWMIADREGRLECRPKRIKAEIFPYDSVDTVELIAELEANGLVIKYSAEGGEYLFIPGFTRHQNPHVKEKPSTLPAYPGGTQVQHGTGMVQEPDKHSSNPPSSLTPSSLLPEEEAKASLSPAEADNDSACSESKNGFPDCPHQEIIAIYHDVLPELPRVRQWNATRSKHLTARWREVMQRIKAKGGPCTKEAGLDWWRKFFLSRVRPSPLLMGKRGKWVASLPWLVEAEPHAKTLEGNYLDREQAA